ncbi:inositol monophosphatase family protein [Kaistia geumhonensis]|uniref:Inositol-1-monophosphatase n=1 Tax=Kaistia geumhonensis TaxID=410839 RepID=A0ABU0MAM7_9HYPH|nr:inositol monophosphatase family protein [Kaistia geumhonensis]MCX5480910.1 inositol monophosphatase family protein [Kaistia geumhonensis]MDQ0517967.1 myo-inositol-1(or 4)-monophosphatase [Kaistia geumhonensis]
MARSALLNVMVGAATKAGRALARDFGEVEQLQVSVKGPGDFVSAADKKAERTIVEELSKARPGYGFLAEESPAVEGSDRSHRWIIDPLDGTTNFLHGIPIFAISIALERDGQIVAGVIFNPVMDELYVAERGGGAFMNERRLRVAQRSALPDCVIATGIPHLGKPGHAAYVKKLAAVMMETSGVRRAGAAALDLAWVASGRYDGFWEDGLKPWDIAAGMLLVREAGGFVSDLSGGDRMLETGDICAGNEAVQRRLLATLAKA